MNPLDPTRLAALAAALGGLQQTVADAMNAAAPAREAPTDPIGAMLWSSRQTIMRNPAAAAGVVDALRRVGEAHAATPHGAALLDGLLSSPEVARLRAVWEAVTLNVLDETQQPSAAPSAWLDLLLDGLASTELSDAVDAIRPEGFA